MSTATTTDVTAPATTDVTAAQTPQGQGEEAGQDRGQDQDRDRSRDPEVLIAAERLRVDELDTRIIALVRDRLAVSEHIQRIRLDSGGRRVHLSREMRILDHYSTELGRPGRDLAMTLLGLCRGQ